MENIKSLLSRSKDLINLKNEITAHARALHLVSNLLHNANNNTNYYSTGRCLYDSTQNAFKAECAAYKLVGKLFGLDYSFELVTERDLTDGEKQNLKHYPKGTGYYMGKISF